jgi:hypothetical protein
VKRALVGSLCFVALVVFFALNLHWVAIHTGSTQTLVGPYYNFWSGFGSDLGEVTLVAAIVVPSVALVRKHNCGVKGCWRLGHHEYEMDGIKHTLCRVHHPYPSTTNAVTAQQVQEHYQKGTP